MSNYTGRSLLATFDNRISEIDAELVGTSSKIAKLEAEIAEANLQREDAYLGLVDLYCNDPKQIGDEFSQINRKLQTIFDEKTKRRAAVNEELTSAAELTAKLREELKGADAAIVTAAAELDVLGRSVKGELEADPEYVRLNAALAEARALKESRKTAFEQIAAECSAKCVPFQRNRIFTYLVKSGFGSPASSRNRLARSLDEWAARHVRWDEQFPSYQILSELPDFAKRRLDEAKDQERFLEARLALRVHQGEASHGIEKAREEHARVVSTADVIRKKVAHIDEHCSVLMEERRALDFAEDPFVQQAKAAIKTFLAAQTMQQLKTRAERSPDVRDDQYVATIEKAERIINEGRVAVKGLLANRSEFEDQRSRALQAQRKFSADYTGIYDQFRGGFDFNALLTGYILGHQSEHLFWNHVDRSYYDDTPAHARFSSNADSSSSSWFDSSSSSGSDASSSFGSGGGDSSGGFSSGGGDSGSSFSTGGGD